MQYRIDPAYIYIYMYACICVYIYNLFLCFSQDILIIVKGYNIQIEIVHFFGL